MVQASACYNNLNLLKDISIEKKKKEDSGVLIV